MVYSSGTSVVGIREVTRERVTTIYIYVYISTELSVLRYLNTLVSPEVHKPRLPLKTPHINIFYPTSPYIHHGYEKVQYRRPRRPPYP